MSIRTAAITALAAAFALSAAATAAETVRVGVLKYGTVNWELDALKHNGFDRKHGVDVEIVTFASENATAVALQAGDLDVIVSDWLWVSRQRASGGDMTFAPYSTSVGAMMAPGESDIRGLADLKDKTIGVAGGPLDKNWLMLQGVARRDHGFDLAGENEIVFGAPPLLTEKARQGELDAVLNFWQYSARLEAEGFRRVYSGEDAAFALGAEGPVASIGYVFSEDWADANPDLAAGFLAASRDAKRLLLESDEEWERLAPLMQAKGAALRVLRERYREGAPRRPIAGEAADAARLYKMLAELGGAKLVGDSPTIAEGAYWSHLTDE